MILRPIPLLVWVDLYWTPTAPRNSQLHLTQPNLSPSLSLQRLALLLDNVLVWYLGVTMYFAFGLVDGWSLSWVSLSLDGIVCFR